MTASATDRWPKARVLVVEDDDAVRTAVDRGLGVHGFDVSSVAGRRVSDRSSPVVDPT